MGRQKQYNTKSREMLIEYFEQNSDRCLSAKDIIGNAELKIGEATVYRLLTKLTTQGILTKSLARDGYGSLYQLSPHEDCNKHFHLKCLDCGDIIHMECNAMRSLESHIECKHDFKVDNAFTVIYGHCKNCSGKLIK